MKKEVIGVIRHARYFALPVLAAVQISACGGGGGSSSPPANLASAPGAAALNAYYQSSHSTSLSATVSGTAFTLTYSFAPIAGTASFEGMQVQSATETQTISGGGSTQSATQTVYYTLNPFAPAGSVSAGGTPYAVVTSFAPIPATISVGQSGPVETITAYHDSTKGVVDGTQTSTYSVVADTPTTLQLCTTAVVSAVANNTDGVTSGTETDCYRVDATGNATLYSIAVSTGSGSVTFK